MFTSKFAWLAAAVIATSVAGSTVTAFAAGGLTNGSSAAQTTANQAQTATATRGYLPIAPGYDDVGPDGLMSNGLLPPSPTYG